MPPFLDLMRTVLPDRGSARASRLLTVNQRTVQKWIADEATAPQGVLEEMRRHEAIVLELDPDGTLSRLIRSWVDAGLHEEIVGSVLAKAHKTFCGREIE